MIIDQFFGLFKLNIKKQIVYRFDFVVWALINIFFLGIQYFLWSSIFAFSGEEVIRGFTFYGMMQYFILVSFIGTITYAFSDADTANKVRTGNLTRDLLKPIKYQTLELIHGVSNRIMSLALELPPLIIVGVLFFELSSTKINLILFSISVLLAFLQNFFFVFCFGLLSFWTKRYDGIRRIRDGVVYLLSGAIFPLVFFPEIFQKISSILPFQYFVYVPIMIFQGQFVFSVALQKITIQLFWVLFFYLIAVFGWKKANKKYSGVGA